MENQQTNLYWAIIHILVSHKQYEFLSMSKDRTEVWLINKQQTIRLKRKDIHFNVWLENDLLRTYGVYEQLKNKRMAKGKKLINLYFTEQLPIDDYEDAIKRTLTPAVKQLGEIETILLDEKYELGDESMFALFGINEDEVRLVKQLMYAGETYIVNSLSAYLAKKNEAKRHVINHGKAFFTYIFLGIQILMFLVLEFNGGSENVETLIRFGAKFNPYIADGQWWRLITPIFLHIGLLHLLMNSVALYYIGSQVERIFGSARFFILYLVAGAAGVFASYLFSSSVSAGASGAIFGCFGAFLYVAIVHRNILSKELISNVLTLIGINLVFGFLVANIDNAGHVGGLLGGFIIAAILRTPAQKKKVVKNKA